MRHRPHLATIAALLIAAAVATAAAKPWLTTAEQQIAAGEFEKTTQLLNGLPEKQQQEHAVAIDSLRQIMSRIRRDFSITPDSGVALIRQRMPEASDELIARWVDTKKIETMVIDGQQWWFRKSVRNLWLLADEFATDNAAARAATCETRRRQALEAMADAPDANGVRHWQRVNATFTVDVKADAVPAGQTLRVWMPLPFNNPRQRAVAVTAANRPYTVSSRSQHHTVYMEATAEAGKPTHFEYSFTYEVGERHVAQQDLLMMLEPYRTNTPEYRAFTADQPPHIVKTDAMHRLARQIVGDEQNPVLQAAAVYNWIATTFPWAGAREYSTISNIPQYVLDNGHGDCGQVTLLYITLLRCLGIPARWESGYMIHPSEVNYHDWAETYFEGAGWVPTDPSFGRSTAGTAMAPYYATGIDVYRMATNEAIGQPLDPAKKFIRSETVDFQPGEVEWSGGNLFYDAWNSHMEINSIEPVN